MTADPLKPQDPEPNGKTEDAADPSTRMESDPLELIEQCLASFPDSDPRQKILYKLRHAVILGQAAQQQREVEFKKVADVIAKLTAPANRIGTLLEVPGEGLARILVGGAEYYASGRSTGGGCRVEDRRSDFGQRSLRGD